MSPSCWMYRWLVFTFSESCLLWMLLQVQLWNWSVHSIHSLSSISSSLPTCPPPTLGVFLESSLLLRVLRIYFEYRPSLTLPFYSYPRFVRQNLPEADEDFPLNSLLFLRFAACKLRICRLVLFSVLWLSFWLCPRFILWLLGSFAQTRSIDSSFRSTCSSITTNEP
jgi:hypothetical protein